MINKFCKYPLWEVSTVLADVAMGRTPADLVIKNAKLVNVCTREIIEDTSVAVSKGRIALVGDASHCIGDTTIVVDAEGRYLAPGFLDGHMHIESSMLRPSQYAKAVLPHGTTGVYYDPHEITNVLGLDGVKCMIADLESTPLKGFLTIPSCVPAVKGFEDTGAEIDHNDVRDAMTYDTAVGLGEMMNFPGIIYSNPETHAIVGEVLKQDGTVTGHYSIPDTGMGLNAYVSAGIRCCHESTRWEDSLAKMRLGMYAMLREGSAWHDLKEVGRAITEHEVDSRYATLISDDTHPNTLKEKGHLDYILSRAVEEGIDPVEAIQMATINCAQCFRVDHEIGSIAPGKCADMVLIDDLVKFNVSLTVIDGDIVARDGEMCVEIEEFVFPDYAVDTVHVKDEITPDTFDIIADGDEAKVRVIEIIPARTSTHQLIETMKVVDGEIHADVERDFLKGFVFERHHRTGKVGCGFIKGFGIDSGAIASTVSHDAHNLFVIGTNDEDMALACNELIKCGGGQCVVKEGKVLAIVPLKVAGLMSVKPLDEVVDEVARMERAWEQIGCDIPSPFMTMAIIPLACLPVLRLTDRGLVDCTKFEIVDLFVKD
ncbi:MAG: adenine deaminase [Clostridia bacterium]|nr:adenine deaminase [Clostridia bacterium]